MNELEKVKESVGFLKTKIQKTPEIGIILGTGLGKFAEKIEVEQIIPYSSIPYFPVSTVEGHAGNLISGKIKNKQILAFQGRFHLYEGYSASEIALPIRVLRFLGAKILLESNAAGGMNPLFKAGNLVIIVDHINLTGHNPLIGENFEEIGVRFPDMSNPYDPEMIDLAEKIAIEEKIPVKKGVLVGLTGPNLETKAEYRFLKGIGADMVCMSTVVEVIAAVHAGLRVFGISVISDMCLPDALKVATFEEILATASYAEPLLTSLMENIIINL
ncbi:MAG TPA: purine-nucleoside phosphorylase [Candidatus Ratteibacteria bacterium]|jgi:purine-nucleoside phosphorylase|uniref:Purine nucleoside phosphorylase n=1 Tax=candidate division TA06 bacterium ADurb.Bin131 TaxID=1852827 RepID=A0A1V6CCN5_UNCT6|nr:MAG: Purine nucleoside phosphorylase 1 [candidate division TA06 bacterium ADurb.Bin131]HOC02402.1 purine-nucleoside phosphorylase [bacterium]HRS06104.1 purine-nucleoside phosphorylase [Candidatus Ratteibacteria bacterium]HON05524.1 purine-nucleoside phosphorylase [bacterium]HPC29938.1 purine-nucleoside phosphorylase [bacterium]